LCEPCVQGPDGQWLFNVEAASVASSPDIDCPDFCEHRWQQEYHIPEDQYKPRCKRIAFRFPPENVLADADITVTSFPRYGGVMFRKQRDQLDQFIAGGDVMEAKVPARQKTYEKVGTDTLVLTLNDWADAIRPGYRFALVMLSFDVPTCPVCKKRDITKEFDSIVCEECGESFHFECVGLTRALVEAMGSEQWFCKGCKREKQALHLVSEKLAKSKVMKAAQKGNTKLGCGVSNQGWKVQARGTAVRTTVGPVRGTLVGQHQKNRADFAIDGVHQEHMASFSCPETRPGWTQCVSVAISGKGNYEGEDFGESIILTGPGGRDSERAKEKNTRTGTLYVDQKWDPSGNLGMAHSCAAFSTFKSCKDCKDPIGSEGSPPYVGSDAICGACQDRWREGAPVRLIRGASTSSKFTPKWGFRYDGIYKVKRFWTEERAVEAETSTPGKGSKKSKKKNNDDNNNDDDQQEKAGEEEEEEEEVKEKEQDGDEEGGDTKRARRRRVAVLVERSG
jgi:hypothetical protein